MTSSHAAYSHIQSALLELKDDPELGYNLRASVSGVYDAMNNDSVRLGQADMGVIYSALAAKAANQYDGSH